MEVYKEYLLTIRNSLIQCGVGLPLKDDYTYEELFELSEVIDQILWYYSILAVSNSRSKLKGFIFSLDDTYMSVMRRMLYSEYCETQKDYRGLFVEDLEAQGRVSSGNISLEDDDQEDALNDFRSLILSKKENKPVEEAEKSVPQFDELDDEDFPDWGGSEDDTEEDEDVLDDSFEKGNSSSEESEEITYISKDSMSVDEKGFYVYDGDEEDEDPDPFLDEKDNEEVEEEFDDIPDMDDADFPQDDVEDEEEEEEEDDADFPELDEEDEEDEEVTDEVDDVDFPEDKVDEGDPFSELEDDVDSELKGWDEDSDDVVEEHQGSEDDLFPDEEDDIFGEDSEGEDDDDLFPDWNEDDEEGDDEEDDGEEDETKDGSQDKIGFLKWGNDSEDEDGSVEENLDDAEEDDLFPSWGDDDTDEDSDVSNTAKISQGDLNKSHKEKVIHKKEYVKDQEDILAETLQGAVTGVINIGKRLGKKGMSHISNNINRKE